MAAPVYAAQTELTGVQLRPTNKGFELILNIQGNNRPPLFTVNRGNSSVTDISNTQLRIPGGGPFAQENPAPGIAAIEVRQLDANTVRIVVDGVGAAPISDIIRRDNRPDLLLLDFERSPSANRSINDPTVPTGQPPSTSPGSSSPLPPLRQQATAPPVGDMAIAPLDVTPDSINLESSQVIPKLLLREAPVREVLTLLGRASGLNVAFADSDSDESGPTISLDIENESVNDVFNYVLRLSGLQANRVGNTVFVGESLPGDAQNRIVRTIRLNQLKASMEGSLSKTIDTDADTGGSVSGSLSAATTAQTAISRTNALTEDSETLGAKELLEDYGANEGTDSSSTLLLGLEVVADNRTNSVTLIGTPRKVDMATALLQRLDVRTRQVAVNVKFVDVNLLKGKDSNADLFWRTGNTFFGVTDGDTLIRSGTSSGSNILGPLVPALPAALTFSSIADLAQDFFARLRTSITEGNAKILTNPTLLVQEGSSAQVNLTEQIFSGFEESESTTSTPSGGGDSLQHTQAYLSECWGDPQCQY